MLEKPTEFGRAIKGINTKEEEKRSTQRWRTSDVFLLFEVLYQIFKWCICAEQSLPQRKCTCLFCSRWAIFLVFRDVMLSINL